MLLIQSVLVSLFNLGAQDLPLVILGTELKPYTYFNEKSQVVGLLPDLMNEVLKNRLGIEYRYELLPWARAQLKVKEGQADAFVGTKSPERNEYADPGEAILVPVEVHAFFLKTHRENLAEKTKVALKAWTGGMILGNQWAENNLERLGFPVVKNRDMASLVAMLLEGRIDYIPENEIILKTYLRELGMEEKFESFQIDSTAMYLYLGRFSPYRSWRAKIDSALKDLFTSGLYIQLEAPYR